MHVNTFARLWRDFLKSTWKVELRSVRRSYSKLHIRVNCHSWEPERQNLSWGLLTYMMNPQSNQLVALSGFLSCAALVILHGINLGMNKYGITEGLDWKCATNHCIYSTISEVSHFPPLVLIRLFEQMNVMNDIGYLLLLFVLCISICNLPLSATTTVAVWIINNSYVFY